MGLIENILCPVSRQNHFFLAIARISHNGIIILNLEGLLSESPVIADTLNPLMTLIQSQLKERLDCHELDIFMPSVVPSQHRFDAVEDDINAGGNYGIHVMSWIHQDYHRLFLRP